MYFSFNEIVAQSLQLSQELSKNKIGPHAVFVRWGEKCGVFHYTPPIISSCNPKKFKTPNLPSENKLSIGLRLCSFNCAVILILELKVIFFILDFTFRNINLYQNI